MTTHNSMAKIKEIIKISDREEAYYQLVTLFIHGPDQVREKIRKGWDFGVEWIYPNPRRLACSHNEQRSSRERILASLVYYAIEDFRQEDPRDKLVALAIIYHSCLAAGLDPQVEFEKVASISSTKMALFFRDFIKRNPEDKSMEAFMLTKKQNLEGEIEIFPKEIMEETRGRC